MTKKLVVVLVILLAISISVIIYLLQKTKAPATMAANASPDSQTLQETNVPVEPQKEPDKVPVSEGNTVEPAPAGPVSHPDPNFYKEYAELLKNFVNEEGKVNYQDLKRERSQIKLIQDKQAKLSPNEYKSWAKEDKIAFWINVYNLEMLKIITDNYPIKPIKPMGRINLLWWPPTSIRHIPGIWSEYKFIVMDEEFTLSEIDKRFSRKEFNEPGVFFAVCNATVSDPILRKEPYQGLTLNKQLEEQIKKFLSRPDSFRIDREKSEVYISSIFEASWYGSEFLTRYGTDKKFKDFQPVERAVLNFISNYISKENAEYLQTASYSVNYTAYDWILNQQ